MDLPDNLGDRILDPTMEHPEDIDFGGHPLFPRGIDALGPDLRKFDLIQIIRVLPGDKREACPRLFKGSELRSWEQIVDLYGGECHYQLQAMCGKTRRYTARSEKFFFGSPAMVPFHPSQTNPTPAAQPVATPPQPVQAPAPYYAAHPQYTAPPPAPMPPPAPAPPPQQQQAASTVTEMMTEITRMITEHNAKVQAPVAATAQQAAPQPQVDPQMEIIRTVAAIIKAQSEAASSDEAEFEFDAPEDEGREEVRSDDNELGQLAALIDALKAKPAPAPEPPVPVFPERLATPFALMALGIADGFAAWTSFGSGVALLSGYWEKPPQEKCLFFEFANYMIRVPQGIGIAMELLFDAELREATKAMMFRWNALARGQIALERLREMWARDPAMIDASRLVRQRMCAAVMRYLKAHPVPKKPENVAEPQAPVPSAKPAEPVAAPVRVEMPARSVRPRNGSPPRTRTPRTSLGMLPTFERAYPLRC